jgi:hypothetical protein
MRVGLVIVGLRPANGITATGMADTYIYTDAVRSPNLGRCWRDRHLTNFISVGQFISLVAQVALESEGGSDVSIWSSVFPNCFHFQNW